MYHPKCYNQDALAALRLPSPGLAIIGPKGDKVKEKLYALRIFAANFNGHSARRELPRHWNYISQIATNTSSCLPSTLWSPCCEYKMLTTSSLWFPAPNLSISFERISINLEVTRKSTITLDSVAARTGSRRPYAPVIHFVVVSLFPHSPKAWIPPLCGLVKGRGPEENKVGSVYR